MEDTSAVDDVRRPSGGSEPSAAPRDLRDWLARAEAIGQITRIREPIDWNEEMGAITYMAHQQIGAPAPLFENIKGCPSGFRALWNIIGSSVDRFALAIGEPSGLSAMDLIQRCRGKFTSTLSPVMVEADVAPVNANHRYGDEVDITVFPAARHWPGDGGRYIGTADAIITRDPDAGWLNVAATGRWCTTATTSASTSRPARTRGCTSSVTGAATSRARSWRSGASTPPCSSPPRSPSRRRSPSSSSSAG